MSTDDSVQMMVRACRRIQGAHRRGTTRNRGSFKFSIRMKGTFQHENPSCNSFSTISFLTPRDYRGEKGDSQYNTVVGSTSTFSLEIQIIHAAATTIFFLILRE